MMLSVLALLLAASCLCCAPTSLAQADGYGVRSAEYDDDILDALLNRRTALERNFMRYGRSGAPSTDPMSRRAENYMRLGRTIAQLDRIPRGENDNNNGFIRFGRLAGDDHFDRMIRSGTNQDNFVRFGRNDGFGRSEVESNFVRFGRPEASNFIRLGRSVADSNFVRFGRPEASNYVRFGRSGLGSSSNYVRFGRGDWQRAGLWEAPGGSMLDSYMQANVLNALRQAGELQGHRCVRTAKDKAGEDAAAGGQGGTATPVTYVRPDRAYVAADDSGEGEGSHQEAHDNSGSKRVPGA